MTTCVGTVAFRLLILPLRTANAARSHNYLTRTTSPSTTQWCNHIRWLSTALPSKGDSQKDPNDDVKYGNDKTLDKMADDDSLKPSRAGEETKCDQTTHDLPVTNAAKVNTESRNNNYSFQKDLDEHVKDIQDETFDKITNPDRLKHFRIAQNVKTYVVADAIGCFEKEPVSSVSAVTWTEEELKNVIITHNEPKVMIDRLAFYSVKLLRKTFDAISGFNKPSRDEITWINRITFLETVAGVPGMVAAMARHLMSLRRMRRDHGWIHTLLEEAENERIHLMTALHLKQPSKLFRGCVMATQGVFVAFFAVAYMISPRYCHRFVGYLEEEAVITYTKCLQDIEHGRLRHWNTMVAPEIARQYWELNDEATMKDVILHIRADEAHHRIVNHTLGSLKSDDYNPYRTKI